MKDYVNFSDAVATQCNEQSQYVSRCVDGRHGSPHLGGGLRFQGSPSDYHDLLIHREDVKAFVDRWWAYQAELHASLTVDTIIRMRSARYGLSRTSDMRPGTYKVVAVRKGLSSVRAFTPAKALVYDLVRCTKAGKLVAKKSHPIFVETFDEDIRKGNVEVVTEG